MAASGEQTEPGIAMNSIAITAPEPQPPAPPKIKNSRFESICTWAAFFLLICPLTLLSKLVVMLAKDTFFISSFLAVSVDPFFLYIPLIDETNKCLRLDKGLMRIVLIMRTIIDVHYILKIFRVIRGLFEKPSKRKNILAEKPSKRKKILVYLQLAIDIVAVLPFPQVLIFILLPKMKGSKLKSFNAVIVLQYIVRLYPIYKFCTEFNQMKLTEVTEFTTPEDDQYKIQKAYHAYVRESKFQRYLDKIKDYIEDKVPDHWVPCIINFIMYIIAGHVIGAIWYFSSIQREIDCWEHACRSCQFTSHCESNTSRNVKFIEDSCPINPANATVFDFGIYANLLQSRMQESTNVLHKLLICLSWGLRNLSSFASNLNASTYNWENIFVMTITIGGLILFIYLLGHLQATNRSERLRKKMKEIIGPQIKSMVKEYGLKSPEDAKIIKSLVKPKLGKNEDLIVDTLFSIFSLYPSDNSEVHDIKYSLFLNKLKKIPEIEHKGEQWLKKFCEHLEPEIYTKGDHIIQQGEPLDMMFFITHGTVVRYASNKSDSDITQYKQEEDRWYGKEILNLRGATSSTELSNLPTWPITLKAHKKVEIFAIKADDLRQMIDISESAK